MSMQYYIYPNHPYIFLSPVVYPSWRKCHQPDRYPSSYQRDSWRQCD